MKYLSLFLFIVFLYGCALPTEVSKDQVNRTKIIKFQKLSKKKIFERAKQWIASNFRSAKAVIEYDNLEEGTLIGNTSHSISCYDIPFNNHSNCTLLISMRLDIKDSKMRVKFFNVISSSYVNNSLLKGELKDKEYEEYEKVITQFISSLTTYIKYGNQNENW